MRNKILFLVMALMSLASTSKAESVKINDFTITQGESVTVTLDLVNTRTDLTAFSLTLKVPKGLTLVEAVATDRYAGQIVLGARTAEDTYTICGIDLGLGAISGTSGALLQLTFQADEKLKSGVYSCTISDVDFITTGRSHVRPANSTFKVTVEKGAASLRGDVNGDELINMQDVTALINYILGKNPSPFVFVNADVNGDELINMQDVTGVINIVLGK